MKFTLVVSDLHSGSMFGLIPPWARPNSGKIKKPKDMDVNLLQTHKEQLMQLMQLQDSFYRAFMSVVRTLPLCDSVFILADLLEGQQEKNGGAMLTSANTDDQSEIAVDILDTILKQVGYPKVYGVRGTLYHVLQKGGRETEHSVYTRLHNVQAVEDVLFCHRTGLIWRLQHFVGRSSVAHGKQTPLAKQQIQNTLAAAMGKEHDADICLFGHVHYCVSAGFPSAGKTGFTCPCLKLRGEAYGRQYNDFYDVGFLLFGQEKNGAPLADYTKQVKIRTAYEKPALYA